MKNLSRFLALSTILTSIAGATVPSPIEREQAMNAGMRYMSSDQDKSTQAQWWSEYQSSNKPIVQYVADISAEKPEAALWFLLTGGKNGFSTKTASPEEQNTLISSMMKIASYVRDKQTTDEGWQVSIQKYDQDQQNVKVFYSMVIDLNKKVETLETDSRLMKQEILFLNKDLSRVNTELENLKINHAILNRRFDDQTRSFEEHRQESKQHIKQLFSMLEANEAKREASLLKTAEKEMYLLEELSSVKSFVFKMMNDFRSDSAEKVDKIFSQQSITREQQARLDSETKFLQLLAQEKQARLDSEAAFQRREEESKRRDDESRKQIQELMTLLAAKNGGGNSPISSLSGFPGGFANYDINSEVSSLASTGTSVGGIQRTVFCDIGQAMMNGIPSPDVSVASSGAFISRDVRFNYGIPPRSTSLPMSGDSVSDDGFVTVENDNV